MNIPRSLAQLIQKSKKSVLLLGPRQTGKSTLIRSLNPDLEINLAHQETFLQFLQDPSLIESWILNHKTIFIDEIQRIPSMLNTLQVVIDNDKSRRFFLTGSSARKLKRGQANLLPGRVLSYELGPFSLLELKDQFQIERALKQGLLPESYLDESQNDYQKLLSSYAAIYIKEEVQAEALTRNLEGFSRFFSVIASRAGDFIDFSKFASQASIERMTARRYFDVLVDTLVINSLEPFAKSTRRRLIQHPRYYFFDVGVLNGALNNFEASSDRKGNLFEHLVLQLILSGAKCKDESIRVSVYRTEADAEVDFILEIGKEVYAIEVKATKNVGGHDLRGLKSFAEFYGKKHRPIVIYLGNQPLMKDGIDVLPVKDAMKVLGYA